MGQEPEGSGERRERDWESGREGRGRALLMGVAALLTWFAALWFMFGDVL